MVSFDDSLTRPENDEDFMRAIRNAGSMRIVLRIYDAPYTASFRADSPAGRMHYSVPDNPEGAETALDEIRAAKTLFERVRRELPEMPVLIQNERGRLIDSTIFNNA